VLENDFAVAFVMLFCRRPRNAGGEPEGVKMSNNQSAHLFRRQLAAADSIGSIVDCIRKMRADGLADTEIAELFRHAADELDAATKDRNG